MKRLCQGDQVSRATARVAPTLQTVGSNWHAYRVGATLAVALIISKGTHRLLVDSHAHIDTARFNADREAVIQAAFEGGVTRIIDPGCDLPSSEMALKLAKAHAGMIFAAVGTHPHDATSYSDEVGQR